MQISSQPKLLPIPFADTGSKQSIPNDSQIGITAGRASYTDGFPPLTRTPLAAGGVPPFGTDFNGVLNDITAAIRWAQAGAGYPFDASFNTAITGFPKGARIPNSSLDGFWLNTTDGNTTNPENTTSALTGWVPSDNYGTTAISGLSGSSLTLTTLQASKERIILTGALTANINITLPAWRKKWTVVNNCTGSFTVTVKTPSGTGVAIQSGLTASLVGDGTNIIQDNNILGVPGRLLNVLTLTTSGTYTPSIGTRSIIVEIQAAGGGGGGANATSGQASAGCGGQSGTYIKHYISSVASSYSYSIGAGGSGGSGSNPGSVGGNTAFGTLTANGGGAGGTTSGSTFSLAFILIPATPPTSGNIINSGGSLGDGAVTFSSTVAKSGIGGSSILGAGGSQRGTSGNGVSGTGYGSGGSGACSINGGGSFTGGTGANGVVIVWEYA